ncbi:MAG: hypothetical protein WCH86_02020 [Kiritimatiellales bacterium]
MKKSARLICMLLVMPLMVHAGLVVGKDEQGVQIRILAVDGKASKGESVRLPPGTHKLAVSCIKTESYGALSVDTILVLTVKPNCDYELLGFFEGKNAKVAVKERGIR